jgi:hypothetical protein
MIASLATTAPGHGAHFQYVERFVRRVIDFLDVQPHDTTTAV